MNKKYEFLADTVSDAFAWLKVWSENDVPELLGWNTSPKTFRSDVANCDIKKWIATEKHLRVSDSGICQDIISDLDSRYE
jgi:hypothetical protein